MKVTDHSSSVPQRTTSTAQGVRQPKAAAPTPVVAQLKATAPVPVLAQKRPGEVFAMSYAAAAPPTFAGATTDILPTSVNPPTDERLARCIDDAFKEVFDGRQFPTGQQRTDLLQFAKEMRARGRCAKEIQGDVTAEVMKIKQGLTDTSPASLNQVIEDNFKSLYEEDAELSPAELQKWMDYAKGLAAQGHTDPNYIKQFMLSEMTHDKQGLTNTSDDTLRKIIKDSFGKVLADAPRAPSAKEMDVWLKLAQQMRDAGHDAVVIQGMIEAELSNTFSNL